jgi:hypothetical protein
MSKVIEYSEDDDALDDDTLDDDALDVNFNNDSPLPSSLDVKMKKANLKKGRFKMKKIATDRGYRVSEKEDSAKYDLTKYANPYSGGGGPGGPNFGGGGGGMGGGGMGGGMGGTSKRRRQRRAPKATPQAAQAASNNAQLITQAKALMQQLTGILNKLK